VTEKNYSKAKAVVGAMGFSILLQAGKKYMTSKTNKIVCAKFNNFSLFSIFLFEGKFHCETGICAFLRTLHRTTKNGVLF
jgi:hypothetical protein